MTFSCLQKLWKSCYYYFTKKGSNSVFLWGIQMVWGPLPKIRRCWWILNCYNSKGLVFPEMLKGSIYIWRAGTFLHISCCLRICFFISLNLHFLKFDENFTFFSNFLNFFYDFSFYVIAQKCCLQQSWAWH